MNPQSAALLLPLLNALDILEFAARHLDPSMLEALNEAVAPRAEKFRAAHAQSAGAPDWMKLAGDETLAAFDELGAAFAHGDLRATYKALRHAPRAQEALYLHAASYPAINRFFVDHALRDNAEVLARCAQQKHDGETGVLHFENDTGARGGFSLYVPEYYTPDRKWPLVIALHGGSGHGRGFLWSWLRDARSYGAILMSPTSTGPTWALLGDDTDTPNINRMIEAVQSRWSIDPARILMTGMSDGGTFCYVSGLDAASRATHLGPVSAAFHPMLASMADADRLRGLPIFMAHGALDWMFPVELAQQAQQYLTASGADVIYREIDDLSHTYPREINAPMLAWLRGVDASD
ncbi:MAG: phospholipase [Rhizobiales bacterium]|nr:phospholipase [Hyphomicrobiales bacterium]